MRERLQRMRQATLEAVEQWAPGGLRPARSGRQLLIVPQDLRTADPSLASEIASGTLGLGGATAPIEGISPFDLRPPTADWTAALHSFEWLRDLRAAGTPFAEDFGRDLVLDWINRFRTQQAPAWSPRITARRVISWLAHAPIVIDEANETEYDEFVASLERQTRYLVAAEGATPDGLPRLVVQMAVMLATLCLSGEEKALDQRIADFEREIDRQILADGGHISRNASVLVELLLDLLPLKQCFIARDRVPPPRLVDAMRRMVPMVRRMRLGDGTLARFNGVGAGIPDALGTVLSFEESLPQPDEGIFISRYARMQRRQLVLVADVGSPPDQVLSTNAFAGCLSFEMSSGAHPVIVNCGAPNNAHNDWRLHARGTPAHSTLVLNNASSSVIQRRHQSDDWGGGPAIEGPTQVAAEVHTDDNGAIELVASHNGYVARFGAVHRRSLRLGPQGDRLEGIDQITEHARSPKPGRSMPFAIHFHVLPTARLNRGQEPSTAEITIPSGECWRLTAAGAELGIEESIHLAGISGPMRSAQIVLRGMVATGGGEIRWRLDRIKT